MRSDPATPAPDEREAPRRNIEPEASPWSPLRHATFRWVWIASIVSNIGSWMHEVGAGWLMTNLSASPLSVALVQVAGAAPMFFLALPAGAFADLVDKRRYLLVVQVWMASIALGLALLSAFNLMTVSLLLVLTAFMGIGTALMMPAWAALIPDLVDRTELPAAVALSSVAINVARAVGPALAGLLVSVSGPWISFAFNSLSFLAVISVLFLWKREVEQTVLPAERLFGAIRAGLVFSRESPPLQRALTRTLAFFIGASAGMALLPLVVRSKLNGDAIDFGLLLGSVGVGALVGAAVLPAVRARISNHVLVIVASGAYAVVLASLALSRELIMLIPIMAISGVAWISVLSSLQIAVQTSVPSWVRARVLSVYILVFFGSMAGGAALWGAVASRYSVSFALLCASAALVSGILMTIRLRLPVTEAEDVAPSLHWPIAIPPGKEHFDKGPVMVTLEYTIAPHDVDAFKQVMREVRAMRRRNGALTWGLVQSIDNCNSWLEFFVDASWLQHMRHHERVTRADRRIESAARRFQQPGTELVIKHHLVHGTRNR